MGLLLPPCPLWAVGTGRWSRRDDPGPSLPSQSAQVRQEWPYSRTQAKKGRSWVYRS